MYAWPDLILLIHLTSLQEKTHRAKSSLFDRVVNQLSAAAATTSTGVASTTSAQAAAALIRFGGITTDRNQDKTADENLREEDGQLSVDTAKNMLKWHAEAIGRCVELSSSNDV
jgi:exocyst complex component 5